MTATRVNRFLLFHNILVRWELLSVIEPTWQHRCWRRMLETKFFGELSLQKAVQILYEKWVAQLLN